MSAGWVRWTLGALMAAVALYHFGRLARRHRTIDADLTHAAMGAVMTLMLFGSLDPTGSRRLALVFVAPTLWFVGRGLHGYVMDGPRALAAPARQIVGCVAMAYMLALAGAGTNAIGGGMAGMSMPPATSASPFVVGLLAALSLLGALSSAGRLRPRVVAGGLSAGCQLAMSVTAAAMLLAM